MKNWNNNIVLPLFFFIILIIPTINQLTGIWKFERASENRIFTDTLHFNINQLDKFPENFDAYYNDNFSFRTPLLDFFHETKFSLFNVSPNPEKLILGKGNWYFMAGEEKNIYEGRSDFSDQELQLFMNEWKHRIHYLDSMHIKTYWMIAPFKHYVYPEKLPFNIIRSKKRRVEQLKDFLKPQFPNLIIDPTQALIKAKEKHKVFYQLDNHWNYRAGSIAAKLLKDKIAHDFPNANIPQNLKINWKDSVIQKGIHYRVLGIKELYENTEFVINDNFLSKKIKNHGFPGIKNFEYNWLYEVRYENKELPDGLTILFIRDSFGKQIMPFIRDSFKESVFIFDAWQYKLNEDIIETVQPDIVVFIGLETHIKKFIVKY